MLEYLHSGFLRSTERWPERPALVVGGATVSFRDLRRRASAIAATIRQSECGGASSLTAVFASRSATAFAGILGALLSGHGYLPLNPAYPVARTRGMLQRSGATTLVVDSDAEIQLPELLEGLDPLFLILPDRPDVSSLSERWPQHVFAGANELVGDELWCPVAPPAEAPAYLLFTSGSTGVPKGVIVTHANGAHFVRHAAERYEITSADRCSQMFDATFDLSVFDMFVAWHGGACVCCPPRTALWNPGAFIRDQRLTVWFSVPTVAAMMKRLGALKPGSYPSLRVSLFCGEGLPAESASAWASAAPHSIIENLYGPTELTVACTAYRWQGDRSVSECELGLVPIGEPLPGMHALVVDDDLREVDPGQAGELIVSGPQRSPGYWRDADSTARAHVAVPGHDALFYRTGDRVRRAADGRPMTFLGRMDHQVKIAGHRVELGEIESSLLELPGVEAAVALLWPSAASATSGIAAFVAGSAIEPLAIRDGLRAKLQEHAIPQTIRVLQALPLNANGKVDRGALATLLSQ